MRRLIAISFAALSVMAIAAATAAGETAGPTTVAASTDVQPQPLCPAEGACLPVETSWEKPVPYMKALLDQEDYHGDGGGVYPFCKIAGGSKRWDYIFGLAHYALHQEVNYCGNGLVTHIAWVRTWPDDLRRVRDHVGDP